ncbi:hypothetical protein PGIGA_G00031460 [Pangasianodon gigas]|uniref:Uncharacterized protein n=1 Tax=Pangasianodon gigas TaxID=30993 RepID=A0ACC5WY73_PANGG|nr:hypothetical protein [Pangasianodon gigas]
MVSSTTDSPPPHRQQTSETLKLWFKRAHRDILNNLDNLDSCDLEEDDLMLDVDLPEDISLHSDVDVAAHYDHSDSNYWPWRKQQQYRGNTEQLHYEER